MPRPGKIYLALDVNYFDDPDIVELSDAAQLHDLRGMLLSKRLGTDGCLSLRQLERIAPDSGGDSLGDLTAMSIWTSEDGATFRRRNWLSWNDSAEQIEIMSRGGKRGNHVKWHVKGKKPPSAKCEFCVAEGLVSPGDRGARSGANRVGDRGSSLHNTDVDVDVDVDEETLADLSSAITTHPRAVAEHLEQRFATVDEARAELERGGCDERAIASVLALAPNLKKAS
jgi:hypothetical protein